jgi:hypothetical protein
MILRRCPFSAIWDIYLQDVGTFYEETAPDVPEKELSFTPSSERHLK